MRTSEKRHVFCPVCTTERELGESPTPWALFGILSVVWAFFCGGAGFLLGGLAIGGWTGLVAGAVAWLFLEARHGLSRRKELVCPVCQFDPLLYRRAPDRAKQRCLDSLKMREDVFLAKWQALKQSAQ